MDRHIFTAMEKVKVTAQYGDNSWLHGRSGTVLKGPLCGDDFYEVQLDTKVFKIHGSDIRRED